jgi:hypothetical protein
MNFIVERAKSFFFNNPASPPTTRTPNSPSTPTIVSSKFAETPTNGDVAEMERESDHAVMKNVIAPSAGIGMGGGGADQVGGKVAAEIQVETSAPLAAENPSIVFPQDVESAPGAYSGGGKLANLQSLLTMQNVAPTRKIPPPSLLKAPLLHLQNIFSLLPVKNLLTQPPAMKGP